MSVNETENASHPNRNRRKKRHGQHVPTNANTPSQSPFRSLTLKNVVGLALGIAIGTAPMSAMFFWDKKESQQSSGGLTSIAPTSAVEAVRQRLPQVAILGEKEAPAGMTEVFIQVPGVLNMQSVYVLADNKTVISGILLPERPTVSVVAGPQITLPTGMPTVDMANVADPSANMASSVPSVPASEVAQFSEIEVSPAVGPITNGQGPAFNPDEIAEKIVASIKENEDPLITKVRSAKTDRDQQEAYWDAVTSIPSIAQGTGKRQLYVFFDPNCPVCHQFFRDIQSKLTQYDLTVHWIPVVIFTNKPSSVTVSATLLSQLKESNDKALVTLQQIMLNPGVIEQIHAQYSSSLDVELPQVITNTSLMALAKAGTPLLVFRDYNNNLAISLNLANEGQLAQIKSS